MRICIDSCIFIRGIQTSDTIIRQLIKSVGPSCHLYIPRLVAQEVTRNLHSPKQVRQFYRLFHRTSFAFIIDDPVPENLFSKYAALGLPAKADAFIGAFAEWMGARYLISDNRHFLRDLQADAFEVVDAETFLARWETRTL
ncbi:MAG TPA: type II toxin-antitoxin system VapC family toxin [Anaerolineae bacterium]|nr:type II toxin-antitoxin system VapC family toxin [Anaerolineae bacterium]